MSFLITPNNSEPFPFKDHTYPVYKTDKGLNKKALNNFFTLTEKYLSYYLKAAIIRIDLHPDKYSDNNKIISSFLSKEIKKLEKYYDCKVCYFFAREQNTSDKQHYHLALFFSGHKVKSAYVIENKIKDGWKEHCNGSTHFVEKPLYIVERGNKNSIDPVTYRLSYLTKEHSKENNGKANSYGFSRLKYKNGIPESDILYVHPEITYRNRYSSMPTTNDDSSYASNQIKTSISTQFKYGQIYSEILDKAKAEDFKIVSIAVEKITDERPP